ncbi:MAG: hypothetical protein ACJ762_20485 [Solirubrobacteraceae bacterium]
MSRSLVAVLATTFLAAALVVPGAASAKTVTFKMTENNTKPATPPDYVVEEKTCKVSGTLGSGRCHSKTTPPKTVGGWKLKGGTIKYTFTTTLSGTVASGKGKITGGTGKFAGARGTFTVRGDILGKFPFVMKGTAKY